MASDNFEKKMERLEQIVESINSSDLQLNKALDLFEEGVTIINELSGDLNEARGRITKFVELLNKEENLDVPED